MKNERNCVFSHLKNFFEIWRKINMAIPEIQPKKALFSSKIDFLRLFFVKNGLFWNIFEILEVYLCVFEFFWQFQSLKTLVELSKSSNFCQKNRNLKYLEYSDQNLKNRHFYFSPGFKEFLQMRKNMIPPIFHASVRFFKNRSKI